MVEDDGRMMGIFIQRAAQEAEAGAQATFALERLRPAQCGAWIPTPWPRTPKRLPTLPRSPPASVEAMVTKAPMDREVAEGLKLMMYNWLSNAKGWLKTGDGAPIIAAVAAGKTLKCRPSALERVDQQQLWAD
ncbi:hypothetical protein FOA52_013054 [Chlamydomonas sp. UWO 241]|nr:hypothetical protein FOA52_013054 [Chlamydomonas sp. UWO 241]